LRGIAAINLGMRGAQATLIAPDADEAPSAMRGKLENEGVMRASHFSTALTYHWLADRYCGATREWGLKPVKRVEHPDATELNALVGQ